MNAEAVRRLLEPILRRHLSAYGFERAEVRLEPEFYGEPAWDVDAIYGENARQLDAEAMGAALSEAREALLGEGEDRFPALHHKFLAEPKAA